MGPEKLAFVREHIKSLPVVASHYMRTKSPSQKYLGQDLNQTKLYNLYVDYITEKGEEPITETFYKKGFTSEFNIGFAPAKTDLCNTCEVLEGNSQHFNTKSPVGGGGCR